MVDTIESYVTRFGMHIVAIALLCILIPFVISAHAVLYWLMQREPYPNWYYIDAGLTAAAGIPIILLLLGFADKMQKQKMDLHKALSKVRELESILPMCAACNKIRDTHGHWHSPDYYIREHTNARVSHSFCHDCAQHYENDAAGEFTVPSKKQD